MAGLGLSTKSRIVDIGCGGGATLVALAREGFSNLLGIDPFLDRDREIYGVPIRKMDLSELDGTFDLLMLHHSFEHLLYAAADLMTMRRLLAPGGAILIRVPVADSFAAAHYGADWVGIDAPRHILIPTTHAMRAMADGASLVIERTFYDSHALQFWGSEQYRRGIPLRAPGSYAEDPNRSPFTADQIESWENESRRLNALQRGDAAGFVLRARPAA